MKRILTIAALIHLGFCPQMSAATEEDKGKIEGTVGIGMIFVTASDNLDTKASKKWSEGLDRETDRQTYAIPFVMPDLRYDIGAPAGAKLYLNTKPPIDDVGGFAINFGVTQPLAGIGTADIGVFLTPFERVWKDPYLTEVGREATSSAKFGAKAGLAKLFDTDLGLCAVYMNHQVDDDVIGRLQPDLARDGAVYALVAEYELLASRTFGLQPRFTVSKGEYDGESNSFVKGRIELEGRYSRERLTLLPQVFYSHATYDKIDPIFSETRQNDGYGAMLIVSYAAPFQLERWA
ncbi:MAG TPA: hypothetical protein DDY32_18630, partial [Desulfobulbaceae bacterium]|nr:hypothetical protein [Desulfobulbaceae bacterium]